MATESGIRKALKNCIDPEISINIVDLGLIYDVKVAGGKVHIKFSLTYPGCPLEPQIREQMMAEVGKVKGVKQIVAELVWEPAWSEKMMTADGKEMIKYLRGF
ncbi:MAG: metal-sulfur cluster assembly factor [Candidatus Micrarchaeota archaeon]